MACAICHKRKPKRHCPAAPGEICALCCGTERENSLDCPLDCPYLQEAHRYEFERAASEPPRELPYAQYEITDAFLEQREVFIGALAMTLLERALGLPGVRDSDAQEALDGLIRTRETLASGLYYESLPGAPVADALFHALADYVENFRKEESKMSRWTPLKEEEILKALVFLARLARAHSNGRPRSKAYLNFLRQTFPEVAAQKTPSGLILP